MNSFHLKFEKIMIINYFIITGLLNISTITEVL